ncbi:hypothetical protein K470DRAFT_78732 [Piedraia hortae CBS 480.64]|uniref:Uncharacterized protein n=1 Tax=Piedraia hortae CBS 480.64 TaxID=1314780 RepID=A0A6A7BXU2_9PEZI|nr:hypothetical protein K470DRAFT_78732 [Piedraia hortae CBS 480.64]
MSIMDRFRTRRLICGAVLWGTLCPITCAAGPAALLLQDETGLSRGKEDTSLAPLSWGSCPVEWEEERRNLEPIVLLHLACAPGRDAVGGDRRSGRRVKEWACVGVSACAGCNPAPFNAH